MIDVWVAAGIRVDALHFWPEARGVRAYLRNPHMHDFRIDVSVPVGHDNREIEFHDLKQQLTLAVSDVLERHESSGVLSFGSMSCEQIALQIMMRLPQVEMISVFEDDFCGARVTQRVQAEGEIRPPQHLVAHNIITMCGSTRFKEQTLKEAHRLSAEGWIVEMVEFFSQADSITLSDEAKARVDQIHKDKIRSSHAIFVVNPGGYVGESTKSEIRLATELNLPIYWLEKPEVTADEWAKAMNMRS